MVIVCCFSIAVSGSVLWCACVLAVCVNGCAGAVVCCADDVADLYMRFCVRVFVGSPCVCVVFVVVCGLPWCVCCSFIVYVLFS